MFLLRLKQYKLSKIKTTTMLVELRKVKLTSTVIKQILPAALFEMVPEHILGWIMEKGIKKILIQNPTSKTLRFHYFPSLIEVRSEVKQTTSQGDYERQYYVIYATQKGHINFSTETDEESNKKKCERLKEFQSAANVVGQIFF